MDKKTIAIITSVTLISLFTLFGVWKVASSPKVIQKVEIPVTDKDNAKGNSDAKVTLVEFSDFQCPACGAYHPLVKQTVENKKDSVRFVYKHFPLGIHKNAKTAAYAAEAAARQGKFWEMHDMLFENQTAWSEDKDPTQTFEKYAKELKLDIEKFTADSKNKDLQKKVDDDTNVGTQVGVNATPTFFLNGIKLDPAPRTVSEFEKVIEEAASK